MTRCQNASTGAALPGLALLPIGAIIMVMLMSGCANVLGRDGSAGGGADQSGSAPYDHPTGAEDVLVSIMSDGGLVPMEYNLRNIPQFLLLGDGTAIVGGVMIEIYPGPAIPPLQSAMLNEGQIHQLFAAADDAGLLEQEIDFGEPAVADAPSTTVNITVDGRTISQSANALGSDDTSSGLSQTQVAAREALQGFIDAAHATADAASLGYQPTGVVAYRLSTEVGAPVDEPELQQPPQTWPIATAPAAPTAADASGATCVVVTGTEAETLLAALGNANELTPWLIGADPPAQMVFRPLLPGDQGCQG